MVANLRALERKNAFCKEGNNRCCRMERCFAARGRGHTTAARLEEAAEIYRRGRRRLRRRWRATPPRGANHGGVPRSRRAPVRHRRLPASRRFAGPCNASVAGYVAAKANARRSVCGRFASDSPPVYQKHREVREAAAVPILWSRELVAAQEQFSNEKPFPTRKFVPFAAQLPNSSAFAGRWRGACDDCASCAVVGASGTLLREKHGAQIDAAQVVLRPNWVRTKGTRTTWARARRSTSSSASSR